MKKTLLGTTALVTAGLLAGPALASDPLKVTVGGNVVTGFYFVDADNVGGTEYQARRSLSSRAISTSRPKARWTTASSPASTPS